MRSYKIVNQGMIEIDNMNIYLDHGDQNTLYRRDPNVVFMAKGLGYLECYTHIDAVGEFDHRDNLNIIELGIYSGGSAIFFDKKYQPKKLVCIDIMKDPSLVLEKYIDETNSRDRIKTYYQTDQSNKFALQEIIEREFDGPIDLVIDDASHWYDETRASFEAIFPYVASGGIFAIEDWNWAHLKNFQNPGDLWWDKSALSNLIFLLVALHASDFTIVPRIGFLPGPMWLQKGIAVIKPGTFSLSHLEFPRGKPMPKI